MKTIVLIASLAAVTAALAQHGSIVPQEQVRAAPMLLYATMRNSDDRMIIAGSESLSARMVDFGVYRAKRWGKRENDAVAGGLVTVGGFQLIESTDRVRAKLGTVFGFRYRLESPESEVLVRIRVVHPAPLRDPQSGRSFAVSEWEQRVPTGSLSWNTAWAFEHEWEIAPGVWRVELHGPGGKLLEHEFEVEP